MMPTVILCMAGLYSRFRKAGYTTPKFLLPVGNRTVLQMVIDGLGPTRLLLIANQRDAPHEAAIRTVLAACGHDGAELQFIEDTSGQAETAAIGAERAATLGWNGPMIFHNIDTVVLGRDLTHIGRLLLLSSGFIDVFTSSSPAYSYVTIDENNRVGRMAEKIVISSHATTGLYGFSSPQTYLDAAEATTERSGGEFYISDVYNTLLSRGAVISAEPAKPDQQTIILGTPVEYETYLAGLGS